MPQLKDTREILKLSIKSIEGSEITLKDGLLAGDINFVYGDGMISDTEKALRVLSKMIIKWNLTDDKDQPLPITLDNVKRLNIKDMMEVIDQTAYGKEGKKLEEDLRKKKEELRT